jgi:ATP-dependent helicase/nuclease subunit A
MSKIPLKPQNETFTDTQWQAIFDKGDNILVSASAGSGKTTVLVRRVIEKLKAGTTIDSLLIVTFTEAAAREMKERIQAALQQAINQESDEQKRQHFVRQLQLLPTANISTLRPLLISSPRPPAALPADHGYPSKKPTGNLAMPERVALNRESHHQ